MSANRQNPDASDARDPVDAQGQLLPVIFGGVVSRVAFGAKCATCTNWLRGHAKMLTNSCTDLLKLLLCTWDQNSVGILEEFWVAFLVEFWVEFLNKFWLKFWGGILGWNSSWNFRWNSGWNFWYNYWVEFLVEVCLEF